METLKFYYDEKFYFYVVWKLEIYYVKIYAEFYYVVIIVVTIIGE